MPSTNGIISSSLKSSMLNFSVVINYYDFFAGPQTISALAPFSIGYEGGDVSNTITLFATLSEQKTSSDVLPIIEKNIYFMIGNDLHGPYITDENGMATWQINEDDFVDVYEASGQLIKAVFSGSIPEILGGISFAPSISSEGQIFISLT